MASAILSHTDTTMTLRVERYCFSTDYCTTEVMVSILTLVAGEPTGPEVYDQTFAETADPFTVEVTGLTASTGYRVYLRHGLGFQFYEETFDVTTDATGGGGANAAPVAVDDTAETSADVPVVVNVLLNDTDPDGDTLAITAISNPAHGTAALTTPGDTDGTVTYTPDAGWTGTDSFTYTIADPDGLTDTATVTVGVAGPPANANLVRVFDPDEPEAPFRYKGRALARPGRTLVVVQALAQFAGSLFLSLYRDARRLATNRKAMNGRPLTNLPQSVDGRTVSTEIASAWPWAASEAVEVGEVRTNTGRTRWFRAKTAGTTGSAEPAAWNVTAAGAETADGTVTWTYGGTYTAPVVYAVTTEVSERWR